MRIAGRVFLLAVALAACAASSLAATPVAVFNFQMKSDTPDWKWLEKGLADRITTDFVSERGQSVVARDEMQLVAQKMNWVPEMATADPRRMKELQSQLKIEYLATGVYSVSGDEISIIGQIVEVKDRAELFRKEVKGRAADVLELQRRLSADLLSWFSKKPPTEILATLPVWTRSLPAAKALYEGMDLYDQGRYAEGWLRFWQASREDSGYIEAQYWVGKMYYFMDRYEHARRALEKFVYLDTTHPRVGDAMVEYVQTYENADASAEALLGLYADLGRRFPNARVRQPAWGEYSLGYMRGEDWFEAKSVQLLGQIGRHEEAARMTRPALDIFGNPETRNLHATSFCFNNVSRHYALTGELFGPDILVDRSREILSDIYTGEILSFDAQARPLVYNLRKPRRILGAGRKNIDKEALFNEERVDITLVMVAPSGSVFAEARFYPLIEGEDGRMEVAIWLPERTESVMQFEPPRGEDLAVACRQGVSWAPLPRTGILVASCCVRVSGPQGGPVIVKGFRVAATLHRVPSPGAVEVSCQDTSRFRVSVDGVFARWFPGLVGPLAPGEHTVTLSPVEQGTPFGEWTTKVTVQAGKVTPLVGRLPWQADSLWSSWQTACVGTDYPGYNLRLYCWVDDTPALQADEGGIRLVWSHRGDLWSSISSDGERFSPPRRLDLPVSSAWLEESPRLLRDESGRFILTFRSDRDARHRYLLYVCWSRDFIHWSAPAQILDWSGASYDVIRDDRGRFIWAGVNTAGDIVLGTSPDGYRWELMGQVRPTRRRVRIDRAKILQRPDGRYELFTREYDPVPSDEGQEGEVTQTRYICFLVRRVSGDLRNWAEPETLGEFGSPHGYDLQQMSAALGKKDPVVLAYLGWALRRPRAVLFAPDETGAWRKSPECAGLGLASYSIAFHPRWGYLIASRMGECGPYLMHGPSLDPFRLSESGTAVASSVPPGPGRDGQAAPQADPKKAGATATLGTLTYRTLPSFYSIIRAEGNQHFKRPAPNAGTVNRNALVFSVVRSGTGFDLAIDSKAPDSLHPDVVRIDPSGKGDFRNAAVVPRTNESSEGDGAFYYVFEKESVALTVGQRTVPVRVEVTYCDRPNSRKIVVYFGFCADGKCRFAEKVRRVRVADHDGNLRINNAARPPFDKSGVFWKAGVGDLIEVDVGYGLGDFAAKAYYGHPVLVDGRLWNVTVSDDGAGIEALPYEGPTGNIQINHAFWQAAFVGDRFLIHLQGGPQPVPMPVGRYRIRQYDEYPPVRPENSKERLYLQDESFDGGHEADVVVRAGRTETIPIGSPLKGTLRVRQKGDKFCFVAEFDKDVGGRPHVYLDWGSEVDIIITDASGKQVGRFSTSPWGGTGTEWKVPSGLTGTLTAEMRFPSGAFSIECEKVTFEAGAGQQP